MELIRQGDVYKYGDLAICPDPPEHMLVELYFEWKKTGVLDLVWYGEPISMLFFLQWFTRKDASNLGVYREVEPGKFTPIGLVWINTTFTLPGKFKRAEVAMGFCRGVDPRILLRVGQMAVEWGFCQRSLDCLLGTTPCANKAAWKFGQKLGFDIAGPVHGMCCWFGNMSDVWISSMDKDMWRKISPFKEAPSNESEDAPHSATDLNLTNRAVP